MIEQLFQSIMGEERVQTLELLHRANPMMCKPDLTPKAKGDQQGRSCLLSPDVPSSRAFTSQIWPHPPSYLLLQQSAREGNWDRDKEQMWELCSGSGRKAALRCFSLFFTYCQCLTLAKLQRSLFDIKSTHHMHNWLDFLFWFLSSAGWIFSPTKYPTIQLAT